MKRILLIIASSLLFITVNAQTTKVIDSFLGVKFGSSPLQVTAALKAKGGVVDKLHSTKDILYFENLSLGKRKTYFTAVRFINDKAYDCLFLFKAELEPKTIDYYNSLASDISDVYGTGEPYKKFKSPYEEGDGYEISAIRNGSAEYETYWGTDDEKQPGSILLEISDKLIIRLSYQDKKLSEIADDKDKAKEKADF